MSLSRDEATPCGDGVFKGVKVAWPGSGGQTEEFPLRSVRRNRFVLRAYSCLQTHTHACMFVLACASYDAPPRSLDASLPVASTSDLSATAAIYLRVWFIDSSTRGRPRWGFLFSLRCRCRCYRCWCCCSNEWRASVWHNYLFVCVEAIGRDQSSAIYETIISRSDERIFADYYKQENTDALYLFVLLS